MNRIHYTECTGCGRMLKLKEREIPVKRCPTCQAQDIRTVGSNGPKKEKAEGDHE